MCSCDIMLSARKNSVIRYFILTIDYWCGKFRSAYICLHWIFSTKWPMPLRKTACKWCNLYVMCIFFFIQIRVDNTHSTNYKCLSSLKYFPTMQHSFWPNISFFFFLLMWINTQLCTHMFQQGIIFCTFVCQILQFIWKFLNQFLLEFVNI